MPTLGDKVFVGNYYKNKKAAKNDGNPLARCVDPAHCQGLIQGEPRKLERSKLSTEQLIQKGLVGMYRIYMGATAPNNTMDSRPVSREM